MSRRSRSVPLPRWATILLLVVVAILWVREELQKTPATSAPGTAPGTVRGTEPGAPPRAARSARCVNVIDGDTLDIQWPDGKRERVRVLGIDCMESHNQDKLARQARSLGVEESFLLGMSKQATRAATALLLNQSVSLVFPQEPPAYDPYNRLLCYVEKQGEDLGAVLLEQGFAEARREPHPRKARYQELNRTARQGRRGIYR